MQHVKRGNQRRKGKRLKKRQDGTKAEQSLERVRLTLHSSDPITGCEDVLYTLFYEVYRGYTIYSTEHEQCCIYGTEGCLRIQGKYVCFPDIEQAKTMIKHFQADGRTAHERMERYVSEDEYECLNKQGVRHKENAYAVVVSM